jgi:signal transduction histidine kinase
MNAVGRRVGEREREEDRSMQRSSDSGILAEVTSLVGHELSTPIATALLYIRIAECHCAATGAPSGLARSALGVARAEVERLKRLIDRVIEIERLGRAVVRPQTIDLGVTVRGTVERALGAVADAGLRDTVGVDVPNGYTGWWDDGAVEQIVRNLLSNALKFGEGWPIRIGVEPRPEGAMIVVRDSGVGIPVSAQSRIFDRETRSPVGQGGGLGLGLWLVRELVLAHGGRIGVHSRPGHGATFSVFLPELSPQSAVDPTEVTLIGAGRRGPRRTRTPAHGSPVSRSSSGRSGW